MVFGVSLVADAVTEGVSERAEGQRAQAGAPLSIAAGVRVPTNGRVR
ncbi:hypothetical protein ThrDRAFT_01590 [Frankia casuarinae]|jgi:hypothetical protein|nr:hypothetical protein CcI6DRAFT_02006 [Frankia sp. CcI6]EYT92812.1 hypothetical protein ThrDRAFT_01590 [Frankia casuarinae]KDA43230.1 hypothetical protein BMG523Draft_01916 [Frankia sp. BMG5.23]OAA30495.1 hypothetical protein AAY23_100760 [Frankia casuarinae]